MHISQLDGPQTRIDPIQIYQGFWCSFIMYWGEGNTWPFTLELEKKIRWSHVWSPLLGDRNGAKKKFGSGTARSLPFSKLSLQSTTLGSGGFQRNFIQVEAARDYHLSDPHMVNLQHLDVFLSSSFGHTNHAPLLIWGVMVWKLFTICWSWNPVKFHNLSSFAAPSKMILQKMP